MGHWRTKILVSLILYFGGFLTAVYVLAPSSASAAADRPAAQGTALANVDTQAWAAKLRGGIDKVVSFAEDNALRAAELIRSNMEQSEK